MFLRFLLFSVVNILVVVTLSITFRLLAPYLGLEPGTYSMLLGFAAVIGMGGSFVSLFLSKFFAKMAMKVQIIDGQTRDPQLRRLVEMVHDLSRKAKLPKMPEVGIYESPEVNAFATGPSKSNSLVAVSSGLLQRMDQDQVEGVLAHEVAHVANGDMITMTLIQGVVNTFVIFFARIVANFVLSNDDEEGGAPNFFMYFAVVTVLEILFTLLGSVAVNFFSRFREFRADSGGARFAGKQKMISALRALQGNTERIDPSHKAFASLKISNKRSGLAMLFSTHPSLENRIQRLERAKIV